MSVLKRREIPMALYIVSMLFILFNNYTGIGMDFASNMRGWGMAIATFAILIGVISISRTHIMRIYRQRPDWQYSIILFASYILFFTFNYVYKPGYLWMIDNVRIPLRATSLIGFNSLLCTYRGSRVKSFWAAPTYRLISSLNSSGRPPSV